MFFFETNFHSFSFNRHGIDLDNPGPGNTSVSLLAAGIANAAYADGTMDPSAITALSALGSGLSVSVAAAYSDSGDSNGARSVDNATPPMHYLTPHVEISMADNNETFSPGQTNHQGITIKLCFINIIAYNLSYTCIVFSYRVTYEW